MNLQYISDNNGIPKAVIVPIKEWEHIRKVYLHFQKEEKTAAKQQFLNELREAVENLNLVKQGKLKAKPLKELLDEL
ncbi:MAG: hypothetical protein ABII90_00025 [Bacteroidota bacterium]